MILTLSKTLVFSIIFLTCVNALAQKNYINQSWLSSTSTIDTLHHTSSIVVLNNLFVTGNAIIDDDDSDIITIKYDQNGDTLWSATYDGSAGLDDYGVELVSTSTGDIIVTGTVQTIGGGHDYVIIKYNGTTGAQIWSYLWDGIGGGIDIPSDVVVDASDNVYVSGGTEDSLGYSNYGTIKLTSAGTLSWINYYDYNGFHDSATQLSLNNKLVVTGVSMDTIGHWDVATLKLNKISGVLTGSSRSSIEGASLVGATSMTSDEDNNIYITGYAEIAGTKNIQTIKLDSSLNVVWISDYEGDYNDVGIDIEVDDSGKVYITGYTEISSGGHNFITIKYNNDGTTAWVRETGNFKTYQDAKAVDIELNAAGDIYVAGTIIEGLQEEIALARYDNNGNPEIFRRVSSDTVDYSAFNMKLSGNDVYISGMSNFVGSQNLTVVKFSIFEKQQPIVLCDSVPCATDDEVLIRFNPDSLIYSAIDDKNIKWGALSDFLSLNSINAISDSVGFNVGQLNCYKVFPHLTSSDTFAISRLGDTISLPPFYATFGLILPKSTNDSLAVDSFNSATDHVSVAMLNTLITPSATFDDTYYTDGSSAGFEATVAIPNANINIEKAWDYETGVSSVLVGVYDGGLNYAHDDWNDGGDETGAVTGGYDYFNDMFPYEVDDPDDYGHGTAIGGIIGAWSNNDYGVAGVAGGDDGNGGVSLHDMKFYRAIPGTCDLEGLTLSEILPAIIDGAIGSGPISQPHDIQNHSWQLNFPPNALIREGFITAYETGVVTIATSGNNGSEGSCNGTVFPGNYPDNMIIQVGANDATGDRASFSNCPEHLDLIAPGTHDLYTCLGHSGNDFVDYTVLYGYGDTECQVWLDGTSLSAAFVVGVSGLMLSYATNNSSNVPYLSLEDCEYFMEQAATSVGDPSETAAGRLNAGDTMEKIWYPKYKIKHETMTVSTATATLVGSSEYTCLEQSMFGLPANSVVKVNRYQLAASNTHSAPFGYDFVTGWARGSSSTNMIGVASTPTLGDVNCDLWSNDYFIPAQQNPTLNSITVSSASLSGYTYEILDGGGSTLGWWPVDLDSDVNFAYTTYWEDPNIVLGEGDQEHQEFNIYPNPTNSVCTIEFLNGQLAYENILVLDISGNLVIDILGPSNLSSENSVQFNVSELSKGIYYVMVKSQEKSFVRKLVIN